MGRVIRILLVFCLLSGGSGAATWYLMHREGADAASGTAAQAPGQPGNEWEHGPALEPPEGSMPVALRPQPMTPEEVMRHALELRGREQALNEREQAIDTQDSRLRIVQADVQAEGQSLRGLQHELETQVQSARQLLNQVLEEQQKLQQQQQEAQTQLQAAEKDRATQDVQQRQNEKQMSKWLSTMTPEVAAQLVKELANNGQLDTVVQMLSNLNEREASKILEAVGDVGLISELTEKFRVLKRPETNTTRR
jgi:hypothetical protein